LLATVARLSTATRFHQLIGLSARDVTRYG